MDLAPSGQLDSMKTVESGKEGMGVGPDVLIVIFEDRSEEFVLRMRDSLDDESVVAREIEE